MGRKLSNYLLFACILKELSKEAIIDALETMRAVFEGQSFNIY